MSSQNSLHKIVIVGGSSAGISVASRLLDGGEKDVAVIDPAGVTTTSRCGRWWAAAGRERASRPVPRRR
jgi:sulfide:quinone oxidoreductase